MAAEREPGVGTRLRVGLSGRADSDALAASTLEHVRATPGLEIASADPDVWLHLGPSEPDDTLCARHGVWVVRWGRGAPSAPGVREVARDEPSTEVAVVRLRDGAEEVLYAGRIPTQRRSVARQHQSLASRAGDFAARALAELALRGELAGALRPRPSGPRDTGPGRLARVTRAVRGQLHSLTRQPRWTVGIADRPIASFLERPALDDVRWLETQAEYLADPFAARFGDRLVVYAEAIDLRDGVGRLVWLDPRDGVIHPVLEAPFHQSYPYLFEHAGRRFCVPERSEAEELALFALGDAPDEFERVATLLEGRRVADATLFPHDGRWWLFFSDLAVEPSCDLHAWHADAPTGPWTPHALTPLKHDCASARPAGTPFLAGGVLHRPAQDCSETYGGAVVIHRIDELTPEVFRETPVQRIEPDPQGPWPEGVHTLSAIGDITLVDGKRSAFSRHALVRRLGGLAAGLTGR